MFRTLSTLLAAALAVALAPEAQANSAAPTSYQSSVEGTRVTICPWNFDDRMCPDQGLLRKEVKSGEVVRLSDCDAERCFVDECVAPGTYQYGFAQPYECVPASASTDYFVEVTVSETLGTCQRTEGFTGPVAHPEGAPWRNDSSICQYGPLGCSCNPGAAVIPVNALVLVGGMLLLRRARRRRQER